MSNIVKYWSANPISLPLIGSSDYFSSFVEQFFGDNFKQIAKSDGHPKYEQFEDKEGNLVLRFLLAGYPKENLSIETSLSHICVKADKIGEEEIEGGCFAKRAFTKEFQDISGYWDFNNSEATYKDGLLIIKIPPKQKENTKIIDIK